MEIPVLQDKTGTIDSKIWDLASPGVEDFDAMGLCPCGSRCNFVPKFLRAGSAGRREGQYIEADYLPVSKKDIKKMYDKCAAT